MISLGEMIGMQATLVEASNRENATFMEMQLSWLLFDTGSQQTYMVKIVSKICGKRDTDSVHNWI